VVADDVESSRDDMTSPPETNAAECSSNSPPLVLLAPPDPIIPLPSAPAERFILVDFGFEIFVD
jgi:hypothetical protein